MTSKLTAEEMKDFVRAYQRASLIIFCKTVDENSLLKGLFDVDKSLAALEKRWAEDDKALL